MILQGSCGASVRPLEPAGSAASGKEGSTGCREDKTSEASLPGSLTYHLGRCGSTIPIY